MTNSNLKIVGLVDWIFIAILMALLVVGFSTV